MGNQPLEKTKDLRGKGHRAFLGETTSSGGPPLAFARASSAKRSAGL